MPISQTPAYNLKAVLKETGITADTLRAWERRYGLPMPERTPGRHRLYSHYDIETVKWLMARQAQGLSISHAVEMWKDQIASGADPLAAAVSTTSSQPIHLAPETSLDVIRSHWLAACLNFDEADAEQALNQAFAIFPLEAVCTEVLQRGLAEIGMQWYENKSSVQQEHFASALAMRRLDALVSAAPAPTREQTILVGCPADEWHTFTPLLLTLRLRRRGFNVIYLGANVPETQFVETISTIGADLTVLVAQQLITAAALKQIAHRLTVHNAQVGFGGRIYNLQPALIHRTNGHYLGATLDVSIEEIQALVTRPTKSPAVEEPSQEFVTALEHFKSHRQQIEVTLFQAISRSKFIPKAIDTSTQFLGDNIIAALQLGDLSLIDGEIDWVKSLLKSNNIPEQALGMYMQLYANAVLQNIDGAGKPVTDWLNKYKKGNA
jgi:MerR family transcriptional regulator, light-induced transcriptional regulator